MSHITLIRHGQANSAATTEEDYDRLSELGHQQSRWLGTYLRDTGHTHTRLYTGTLRRHIETADAMETGLPPTRDARLNELEYYTLCHAYEAATGTPVPLVQADFITQFPKILSAWKAGDLEDIPETYQQFETRVSTALKEIGSGQGPALVITSGGVIGMSMRQHLDLDIAHMARMIMGIMNTSQHRLFPIGGIWSPVMFNSVPHLERPERHSAQTHI